MAVFLNMDLTNSCFLSSFVQAFGGLQNLTQLDISYNNISNLSKEIFGELTSLQELNMGFNPLKKLYEGLLQHTPDLRVLDLSKLGLMSIPPNFFVANLT